METKAAGRRPWVVLLYFYVAALVGLGFVVTGTTTALFGLKDLVVPQLSVSSLSYDSSLRRDAQGNIISTDQERAAARQRAVDDRRREGANDLIDGVILTAVGLPTLLWHLRRARRISPIREPSRPSRPGRAAEPTGAEPTGTARFTEPTGSGRSAETPASADTPASAETDG
jgi:hypothetical protein